MEEFNPYEPPTIPVPRPSAVGDAVPLRRGMLLIAWIAVFALNMAIPLLFGWSMTADHGRAGMSAGAFLLCVLGVCVCVARQNFARPFLVGATLVGLTQVFPMLQIVAGMIGMEVGHVLGGVSRNNDVAPDGVTSELGGFVVTIVTGGTLLAASAVSGLLLRILTPDRWWREPSQAHR